MGIKSSFDNSELSCIDKYIGTAYDDVKIVADHIEEIQDIAEALPQFLHYLGAYPEDPTERPNGDPLESGDYYLNTTDDVLKFYNADHGMWTIIDPEEIVDAAIRAEQAAVAAEASAGEAANSATEAGTQADRAESEADRAQGIADNIQGELTQIAQNTADISDLQDEQLVQNQAISNNALAITGLDSRVGDTETDIDNLTVRVGDSENAITELEDDVADLTWKAYARTQADMEAERSANSNQFAASGFVDYGKHLIPNINVPTINEGLWAVINDAAYANVLRLGRGTSSVNGTSDTDFARTVIAGMISDLVGINRSDVDYNPCEIKFPEAPNGVVIYDSTGDVRGTGNATLNLFTEVDPKYGDVAGELSEAMARAFEGEIKNGDFRSSDVSDWIDGGSNAVGSWEDGRYKLVTTGSAGNFQDVDIPDGTLCTITITGEGDGSAIPRLYVYDGGNYSYPIISTDNVVEGTRTFQFTSLTNGTNAVRLRLYNTGAGTSYFDNIQFSRISEEVVTERYDMYGAETFLEQVTLANPYVYPKGCIQSKATTMNGLTTVSTNRPDTYYAVFDGDTDSSGLGVDFFAATDEQKVEMLSDASNNLYLLEDGTLAQWRVRQRTIAGAGNGDWENIDPVDVSQHYIHFKGTFGGRTVLTPHGALDEVPNGKSLQIPDTPSSAGVFDGKFEPTNQLFKSGVFNMRSAYGFENVALNSECYFHVWGTIPRLNKGAYHPSFNPLGAAAIVGDGLSNSASGNARFWYSTDTTLFTSTQYAFTHRMLTTSTNGSIGSTSRRDDGKFYDAIYASGQGGVIDERMSAWDMSSPEEVSKVNAKLENGTFRGKQILPFTEVTVGSLTNTGTGSTVEIVGSGFAEYAEIGDKLFAYKEGTGEVSEHIVDVLFTNDKVVVFPNVVTRDDVTHVILIASGKTFSVEGAFTVSDVVGDPTNILQTPQLADGWAGHWIPVIPDGTSKSSPITRKHTGSSTGNAVQFTDDLGASWTGTTYTIEAVTNTYSNSWPTDRVGILNYTAAAYMTEQDVNRPVYGGKSGLGNVHASMRYPTTTAALLFESMIGKVLTGSFVSGTNQLQCDLPLWANSLEAATGMLYGVNDTLGQNLHTTLPLGTPNNNSPACKTLSYTTTENQGVHINYAYNELKHDGTDWGDDSTVRIIDGQGTFNNLNGESCLYGTNRTTKRLGWTKNKARYGEQTEGVDL